MNKLKDVPPFKNKIAKIDEIISEFTDLSNFPFVVFNINIEGPNVAYHDFQQWPNNENLGNIDNFLLSLSVFYVSAIGNGHNYTSGVFELPAGKSKEYRMMIISVYFGDTELPDYTKYLQFGLFIPKKVMKVMPSSVYYEDTILEMLKSFIDPQKITNQEYQQIKYEILKIVFLSLINQFDY